MIVCCGSPAVLRCLLPGLAVAVGGLLLYGRLPGPAPAQASANDQAQQATQAIRTVLDDQVVAWNRGDLAGFMAGYWNSPQLTFSSGKDRTRGWQATLERYQKRYQAEGREMGQLTFSELEIEPLCADSAFVRGRWKLVTHKETLGGQFTLICKKLATGWRIVHDHTSS
jgi:beta-aspartyl-peptidase (threonine type)